MTRRLGYVLAVVAALVAAGVGVIGWWSSQPGIDELLEEAQAARRRGEYARAVELYDRVAERGGPDQSAQAHTQSALLLLQSLARLDESEKRFRRAIEVGPDHVEANRGLAMVLAILGGLATAVEAGVIGALAVLLIGLFVYRELRLRDLGAALYRTAQSSAMILFLIAAAGLYGWVAAWQNLPAQVAAVLTGLTDDPVVFLLMVNVMLLALGMVLDPMPALVLVVPVFLPVATDSYGIDPMQFGLITCINLTLGLLTPPVGSGLFTAARLNAVSPVALTRRLLPYLGAAGAVLLLLTFVPAASTGLVGLLD